LQTIFEFQSLLCMLTGADVCNASMYDGGSAVAEAVLMASRLLRREGRVLVSEGVHPAHREIAETYSRHLDIAIEIVPLGADGRTRLDSVDEEVVAVVVQQPNFYGVVEDLAPIAAATERAPAKLVVSTTEPLALALLEPPGKIGADIVVGELQGFGNPLNFGGPMVGFMASRGDYVRNLPGRLVGETVDADGDDGFVLTLATREQHIRRAKATSNICTNEALCALATCIYLCSLGRRGLRELAEVNLAKAAYAREALEAIDGVESVFDGPAFNEVVVRLPGTAAEVVSACIERGLVPGLDLGRVDEERADQLLV
jgi:glycine dehydrogenase subunit 1